MHCGDATVHPVFFRWQTEYVMKLYILVRIVEVLSLEGGELLGVADNPQDVAGNES